MLAINNYTIRGKGDCSNKPGWRTALVMDNVRMDNGSDFSLDLSPKEI